jgi:hypothetical protein
VNEDWDRARYEREKRNFIESRSRFRPLYFHAALIFTVTWLAGWASSWALLKLGMGGMPLRYGLSFLLSYLVFVGCVRVWADFMRAERGNGFSDAGGFDLPFVDSEGCAVVMAGLSLGLLLAGVFALAGGLPLLLEVAFEVVFAGVIVKRLSRRQEVGNWFAALVRQTWLHALVAWALLVSAAGLLQQQAPEVNTFAAAIKAIWIKSHGQKAVLY